MEKKEKVAEMITEQTTAVAPEAVEDALDVVEDNDIEEVYAEGGIQNTEREGAETVYKDLGLNVQRIEYVKKGEVRNRFRIAFRHTINGESVVMEINLVPANVKSRMLHTMIAAIYGNETKLPLEIVKTIPPSYDGSPVTPRYNCRITHVGADGIPIAFNFNTSQREDAIAFTVLRDRLIAKGLLK